MPLDIKAKEIAARLNKKMGEGHVVLASDTRSYPRVTTGSLGLDVILGGGWAANQWHEIIGEASAGKTNLAFATIAANQARDNTWCAVMIAAETFVPEYARMCGVDTDRLLVVETNIMEEAYAAAIEFIEAQAIDCVIIDSLPALVPSQEDEKQMDENTVGRGALLTGKFFRKVGKATKRNWDGSDRPVLGLCINQYRMKIGVTHGDPRTTPGGKAKDFAYFTRVEVARDEWIEAGTGAAKERIGQVNRAKTIKNKSAPPQQTARYDVYFAPGGPVEAGRIDYAKEIATLSVLFGVVSKSGSWLQYGDRKWQGAGNLAASIREEVDLLADLEAQVLRIVKNVA